MFYIWSHIAERAHGEFCNVCTKLEHMVSDGRTIYTIMYTHIFRAQLYTVYMGLTQARPDYSLTLFTLVTQV